MKGSNLSHVSSGHHFRGREEGRRYMPGCVTAACHGMEVQFLPIDSDHRFGGLCYMLPETRRRKIGGEQNARMSCTSFKWQEKRQCEYVQTQDMELDISYGRTGGLDIGNITFVRSFVLDGDVLNPEEDVGRRIGNIDPVLFFVLLNVNVATDRICQHVI